MNFSPSAFGGRLFFRWCTSQTVRRAIDLRRQVWRLLNEQRDLLVPAAADALKQADQQLAAALNSGSPGGLRESMTHLENVANERLLPFPHGSVRENVKELAVAVTVIFAFTTF